MKGALMVLLAFLGLGPIASAAPAQAAPDASRLRTLFFSRDYETAVIESTKALAASPDSREVKAWTILNMARNSREDDALRLAREMTAAAPSDEWSLFALAGALHYKGGQTAEAIETAARALAASPDHPDFIWLRAQTLAGDATRRDEALAFIDSVRGRLKNPAEILATKGYALYSMSMGTPVDDAKRAAAFAAFEESRRTDPSNVNARYLPAVYFDQNKRADEALPLFREAIALSPGATSIRSGYWNAIRSSRELDANRKQELIAGDLDAFLDQHGERPGALLAIANAARASKDVERTRRAEDRILAAFNDTREAEWVFAARWREYRQAESAKDPAYRKLLTEFTSRPRHLLEGLLGEAYRNLFFVLIEDPAVPVDELVRVANGMLTYERNNPHITVVRGPIIMADRKVALADAERIAREGFKILKGRVEEQRSFYKTAGEFEEALNYMLALGHDALGWVLVAQGRMEEAEKELLTSYELNHNSRDNLNHLGRFYEAKGDTTRAEEFYVKGLAVQSPGVNPSEASLKALYAKKHGGEDGFDGYLEKLRDADRERRHATIVGERSAGPEPAMPFNLQSLDGARVTLDSLKGRIAVINFWGIWCGWCVQEMPEFQKLHEKYASDPDVAILTIDNDENPDDVPPWMKEKGYTFPVLLDDGYVSKAGVSAFPTTWFLDREGRKAFVKIGWSEKLLEEFSWRVEALRTTGR